MTDQKCKNSSANYDGYIREASVGFGAGKPTVHAGYRCAAVSLGIGVCKIVEYIMVSGLPLESLCISSR
jgi:hypothetical protein